jgi:nucleotide-binding universal stress UspA family protein
VKHRTHVTHGEPTAEILRLAEQERADLLVIATHGRTGLKHFFLGSVVERVIRHASCPVLVVR